MSAGKVIDQAWRALLAASVSQFELPDCLNQVRHLQSSIVRKISPFPAWNGLSYGLSD